MEDYKVRMIIEYVELMDRIRKLQKTIMQIQDCEFVPNTPIEILKRQLSEMIAYKNTLVVRSYYERVNLYEYDHITL